MASLEFVGVTKSFSDTQIIKGIDLVIEDGEFVVFVGPSGCGKSTLLRMIAGLDAVTSGHIRIGGRDVEKLTPGERGIAMVFQSYALYPHMTVRENLAFGLQNFKLPKAEIEAKVLEAARMLAMEAYLDRRPRELSGGQRQRVAIGRAIVRDPSVFLFDEPLSNLDAALRVNTRAEIIGLHRRLGTTMIYVTHDQIEAMTMADRIVVLNAGQVEQFGTPEELFMRPRNRFVARFIGSPRMNILAGTVVETDANGITVDLASFGRQHFAVHPGSLTVGSAVEAGVRPQHMVLSKDAPGAPFRVTYAESIGTETYVYGTVDGRDEEIILHMPTHMKFTPGQVEQLSFAPATAHLFDAATGLALEPLASA